MPSESPVTSPATPADKTSGASPVKGKAPPASPESNIKDTVESILVAFILAFIFRAFVVEAFVIPTGSMAPTLMGAHMRFRCPDCGYPFDVNFNNGGSGSDDVQIPDYARDVDGQAISYQGRLHCPNCGREVPGTDPRDPDNGAVMPPVFYGDRILVLKYLYLFQKPQRWDVVVFKAPVPDRGPHNEKSYHYTENYIKRLVGLPGETIMILDGDVYVKPAGANDYFIQRKPYSVQKDLWRVVYDNDYIPQDLPADRPRNPAWKQPWTAERPDSGWATEAGGKPSRVFTFKNAAGGGDLTFDADANPATHALSDWVAYDQLQPFPYTPVSDLRLTCDYQRQSGDGPFDLELTKGPDVFRARLSRGRAVLLRSRDGGPAKEVFSAPVPDLEGSRPARIEFANCDYHVWLRVNGKPVFDTADATDADKKYEPDWHKLYDNWMSDPPRPTVRLLAEKQEATVEHLCLARDIYYGNHPPTTDSRYFGGYWGGPGKPIPLQADPKEYFVLGDNSPISGDARTWSDPVHLPAEMVEAESGRVPEQFMLGKAFFVYWPAGYRPFSKDFGQNSPVLNPGIVPNFGDMRSIH